MSFNLVKDLFKRIEGPRRSVSSQIEPEKERIFNLGALRKKKLTRCQISRLKTCYIEFQHNLFLIIVRVLFKGIEGPTRSFSIRT